MSRSIVRMETLVYYDGPEVVLAFDQLSTRYVCVLVERSDMRELYFCTPISPEKSISLISGNTDLRSVFITAEIPEFFTLEFSSKADELPQLSAIMQNNIPEKWFPTESFYITESRKNDPSLVTEAQRKNRAIIELSLDPPEAANETKIKAANLGYALTVFQTLVKHAYHKSIASLSAKARKFLDQEDNFDMEVIGFASGSFKIRMQSRNAPDLTGYTEISRGFLKIDEVMSPMEDPEQQKELLRKNAGHFLKAFEKFIKLAIDFNSSIAYSWTIPESSDIHASRLSRKQAEPIYSILCATQELSVEKVVLHGRITRADIRTGLWTLFDEDNEIYYSGKSDPAAYVSLSGVTIQSKRYELNCEEHLIEEAITRKEKTQLFLISYQEL